MKASYTAIQPPSNFTKTLIIFIICPSLIIFSTIACIRTFYGRCLDNPCYSNECIVHVEELEDALGREQMLNCTWYTDYLTGDGDVEADSDVDSEIGPHEDADSDTSPEHDSDYDRDEDTCEPQDQLACDEENNVIWVDSCGNPDDAIVEACHGAHTTCRGGTCACEEGWTGEKCEQCLVFVNGASGDDSNFGRTWESALVLQLYLRGNRLSRFIMTTSRTPLMKTSKERPRKNGVNRMFYA